MTATKLGRSLLSSEILFVRPAATLFFCHPVPVMSSEQIAKALKGAGLSAEERIDTAFQAWKNDKLFFPNKDDFLLEWLCTALTRSKLKS